MTFILLILSTCVFAKQKEEFLEFGLDKKQDRLKTKKTNFQVKMGANLLNYKNGHTFTGTAKRIDPRDEPMGGADLSLGYQISLYGPLTLTINGTGFYYSKNDDGVKKAEAENINEVLSNLKRRYSLYGGGFSGSLNYEFSLSKNFLMQPFVEFGGGIGKSKFKIDYQRFLPSEIEHYKASYRESFKYAVASLGFNIISNSGIFSFFKVSNFSFLGISRKYSANSVQKVSNAAASTTICSGANCKSDVDGFSDINYSVGMGYTF